MADAVVKVKEGKTWIEIILMPLVVAMVGILGSYFISSRQEESVRMASQAQIGAAERTAEADRQVKLLEIFSEKIAGDEHQRLLALRILGALEPELRKKLATAVAESEPAGSRLREVAQQVAGKEVSVTVLPAPGDSPVIPPAASSTPAAFRDVELSRSLELPGGTMQTVEYHPVTSVNGTTYQRGVFLDSPNTSPGSVSYRIPKGAKFFVATAIARDAGGCGGGGNVNGWTVTLTTPRINKSVELSWQYLDPVKLRIPVDDIPAGGPNELTITVNPRSDRTCDHPALVDAYFTASGDPGR